MFNEPIKPLVLPETQTASYQKLLGSEVELKDFFGPFLLSRKAANCKKATIQFYQLQLSCFFDWLNQNNFSSLALLM